MLFLGEGGDLVQPQPVKPQPQLAWPSPVIRRPRARSDVAEQQQIDDRMTQSLYNGRPDSRESNHSAVSFFVDVSKGCVQVYRCTNVVDKK